MIEVGVVDLSAEGRRKLAALVERWAWVNPDSKNLSLPRLSTRLLSPEEVRFHGSLDVCLIGPELVACDAAYVATLRKQLSKQILICVLDSRSYSFGMVEQLGRLEVDDILMDTASSDEFFRRLVLLTRRVARRKEGKLVVVDSARGGVGCTFVAAGLAESHFIQGRSVCVVDGDVVSQDLTRFLQSKPFVNEPLKILLDQQRVQTLETVRECVFQVWADEARFVCMPPPAACDQALLSTPIALRTFIGVLESLSSMFDVVIIDASALVSSVKQALCQVAETVVFVANRDPAGAYANRHALSVIGGCLRREGSISVVLNDTGRAGAPLATLKNEVLVAGDRNVNVVPFPYSAKAGRWACSGSTPARPLRRAFARLLEGSSEIGSDILHRGHSSGILGRITAASIEVFAKLRRAPQTQKIAFVADQIAPVIREAVPGTTTLPAVVSDTQESELVSKPTLASW